MFWYFISILSIVNIFFPILSNQTSPRAEYKKTLAAATTALPDLLFKADSPWNQPIGTNVQLDPNSSTMVQDVASRVNPTDNAFGMPLYISTASDPTCNIHTGDSLFNSKQPIHVPSNAAASTGDDHWLFIYDTTKNLIFEMWLAQKSGNCWNADTGNVYDPSGDGVLQPDGSTQDGNGASYFGGVVNINDANRGYINHALSLASEHTVKNQGRYPMNQKTDGDTGSGHDIPMGARFQLDPTFNCDGMSGASKGEIMVCHAMQTYGGYMHDTGGVPMSIYFQEDKSAGGAFGALGINENQPFTHIPWTKMRVLKSWNSYTPTANTPTPNLSPTLPAGSTPVSVTVCPHALGNCGDSINPRGGNTNLKRQQRQISITFTSGSTTKTYSGTIQYVPAVGNFQGIVPVSGLANGSYTVTIAMNGFLPGQIFSPVTFTQGQTLTLPSLPLLNGNSNNDDQINILDYNILRGCYQSTQSSCTPADFNDDGIVDGIDYNIFLREWLAFEAQSQVTTTPTPTQSQTTTTPNPTNATTPTPPIAGKKLTFDDEFNGTTLDKTKWNTCFSNFQAGPAGDCRHDQSELQLYTPNNVTVSNGILHLIGKKESISGFSYTSGMISSGPGADGSGAKFSFKYGYMEMRAKVPGGKGIWPAYWAIPIDRYPPEIDVFEILGDAPNVINMHYHTSSDQDSGGEWTGPDFTADWHTYAVDWESNSLTWYVDGVQRRVLKTSDANVPLYLIANLAIGGDWPGNPNSSTPFPSDFQIDYIRVWQ